MADKAAPAGVCVGTTDTAGPTPGTKTLAPAGLVSTIGFGVGLAGLAASAVLLLTEPKAVPPSSAGARLPRNEPSWRLSLGHGAAPIGVSLQRGW